MKFIEWLKKSNLPILILLAAVIWIARFWFFKDFGFYEDDYYYISSKMGSNWAHIINSNIYSFTHFYQGRPLLFLFPSIFSFFGSLIGGMHFLYIIAFIILLTNSFLFYNLLRKFLDKKYALLGVILFALFPTDTTQAYLIHTFSIQISVMFFLTASLLYLSNKKIISYIFIFLSLMTYETLFLLFSIIPFLKNQKIKINSKIIWHWIIMFVMVAFTGALRFLFKEEKISKLSLLPALKWSYTNVVYGPVMVAYSYVNSIVLVISKFSVFWPKTIFYLVLFFIGFFFLFYFLNFNIKKSSGSKDNFQKMKRLLLISLILIPLAYPLTLTVSAESINNGRSSRVHLAACIGTPILIISLIYIISSSINFRYKRQLFAVLLALLFTFLIGFCLTIQNDYKESWHEQKVFWKNVLRLCPDIEKRVFILYSGDYCRGSNQICAYSWSMPLVLDQIYYFDSRPSYGMDNLPSAVLFLQSGWINYAEINGTELILNLEAVYTYGQTKMPKLFEGKVILLENINGTLVRRTGNLTIDGKDFMLKPVGPSNLENLEKGPLYKYLIEDK